MGEIQKLKRPLARLGHNVGNSALSRGRTWVGVAEIRCVWPHTGWTRVGEVGRNDELQRGAIFAPESAPPLETTGKKLKRTHNGGRITKMTLPAARELSDQDCNKPYTLNYDLKLI